MLFLAAPRGLGVAPCLVFLFLRTGQSRSSTSFAFLSPRDASASLPSGRRCEEKNPSCHACLSPLMPPASSAGCSGLVCSSHDQLSRFPQMCSLVCHCLARLGGIHVSPGLACCCACTETLHCPMSGSPDVSTDAGILRGCQMSGNVGYAPMHRNLELFLAWKSLILLCARDWTLREFWMGNCTRVM